MRVEKTARDVGKKNKNVREIIDRKKYKIKKNRKMKEKKKRRWEKTRSERIRNGRRRR